MRPTSLNPLFAPASDLPGIGPKLTPLVETLVGRVGRSARVLDLAFHLPIGAIDRRLRPSVAEAEWDAPATLRVEVQEHRPPPRGGRGPYKVIVGDGTGDVTLVFFHNNPAWIAKALPLGAVRYVSGKLELWDGRLQMAHPDRVLDEDAFSTLPGFEPVYALTDGLHARVLAKAVAAAVARVPDLPEWRGDGFRASPLGFREALAILHQPTGPVPIEPAAPAVLRLAADELLANQLALVLVRARLRQAGGRASPGDGRLVDAIRAALPFTLTGAQEAALAEIRADIAAPKRMLRLLQGDVGSGKTLVALLAMASAVEAGRQAAMMAPTDLLARQHLERLTPLCAAAGVRLALLTGRDTPAERARTLAGLADGSIAMVVGTHALFQEAVAFADLGLAVVDEQHRFGVRQRLALAAKGQAVDMLVMTATPIPRTLVLTRFGDMEVSNLREKPAGRQPIDTRAMPVERLDDVVAGLARAIDAGAQVYWVCPLVEESEGADLTAAQERHAMLAAALGPVVGLIHGQMPGPEKDAAMERFLAGDTRVLVATTVIEVGVDVPNATIIVIEHAERFGLAQLHQLRGRVGRGAERSSCLLVYKGPLGATASARIETLRETQDGFEIAAKDLRLRGEGDVLGERQSGTPGFRFADLEAHAPLLRAAREDAVALVTADPDLRSPRGEAARVLLYLFDRDDAVRLLAAG